MNTITFITALLTVSLVLSYGDYDNQKHGDYDNHGDYNHGDYDYHGDYDNHGDYDDHNHGDYGDHGDNDDHNHGKYGDHGDNDDHNHGNYGDHGDNDDQSKYHQNSYEYFNCEQYTVVYNALDDLINSVNFSIQVLVRLAFHDCVGNYGCNGCLNPNDPNNNGLGLSTTLDSIYDKHFTHVLSRADFYALAGHVALIRGVFNTRCKKDEYCPSLFLDYRWGRKDCPTSPNTTAIDGFPDAHGDFSEVSRILYGMFKLNSQELVALMGCHSLGGAQPQFSGFNFNWQIDITTFNNAYFQNMLPPGFIHENVGNKTFASRRFEFVRNVENDVSLMMFNVDFSILKAIIGERDKKGAFTGHIHCNTQKGETEIFTGAINQIEECQEAPTASVVIAFANDLQLFYNVFSSAWFKMVATGTPLSDLKSPSGYKGQVCGTCVPWGATCAPGYSLSGACCKGLSCKNNVCR